MMNTYKFEVYPEIHCDDCDEITHNHFDCPICNEQYSDSNRYSDLTEDFIADGKITIQCENCGVTFTTDKFSYSEKVEWELTSETRNQQAKEER